MNQLPRYNELLILVLEALRDGKERLAKEITSTTIKKVNTPGELGKQHFGGE